MTTLKEKDLQEEIRAALSRERSLEKREEKELKKAQATGRVTSFLRNRANSDEALRASIALTEASNPTEFAQATIQYQKAVETTRTSTPPRIEQSQPDPQTILPPRPDDNIIYSLTTQNTELSWREGGGGGGETPAHPWKITIRTVPESDPPIYQYAIESASRLFNGFGGVQVAVNGADGVFRKIAEGFYFIEVDFANGEVSQAQIQIKSSLGNIIETLGNPPQQTKLRQQIGYVYFDEGVPKVRQNAWHNYSLFETCNNGAPVKVTIAT